MPAGGLCTDGQDVGRRTEIYKDESTELVYETLEITNVLTKVVIEKTVKDSDEKLSGVQFAFWNKQMTDGLDDGIAAKETVKTNKMVRQSSKD